MGIEQTKAYIDYAKYLSGLSTGAVVLVLAFVKDAFAEPVGINILLASLSSFGGTVASAVILIAALLFEDWSKLGADRPSYGVAGVALLVVWVLFTVGILTLLVFAAKNFLAN